MPPESTAATAATPVAPATLDDLLQPHVDVLSTIVVCDKSYTLVLGDLASKRRFVDANFAAVKEAATAAGVDVTDTATANDLYAVRLAHWMLSDQRSVPQLADDTIEMTLKLSKARGPIYERLTNEAIRLLNQATAAPLGN